MNQLVKSTKLFPDGHQVTTVRTNGAVSPAAIAEALQLPRLKGLLVLSGGAGKMSDEDTVRLHQLFRAVGQVVAQNRLAVIDGGTQSGVMKLMGECVAAAGGALAHIGVVPAFADVGDGRLAEDALEPNHSYFVLVESDEWGGEVETMYNLAEYFSVTAPSVAMLVNGGGISLQEVEWNVKQGREVVVIVGSGRLADEIARAGLSPSPNTGKRIANIVKHGKFTFFDLTLPPENLTEIITQRLIKPQ